MHNNVFGNDKMLETVAFATVPAVSPQPSKNSPVGVLDLFGVKM